MTPLEQRAMAAHQARAAAYEAAIEFWRLMMRIAVRIETDARRLM